MGRSCSILQCHSDVKQDTYFSTLSLWLKWSTLCIFNFLTADWRYTFVDSERQINGSVDYMIQIWTIPSNSDVSNASSFPITLGISKAKFQIFHPFDTALLKVLDESYSFSCYQAWATISHLQLYFLPPCPLSASISTIVYRTTTPGMSHWETSPSPLRAIFTNSPYNKPWAFPSS